jgi:hypothetical protein
VSSDLKPPASLSRSDEILASVAAGKKKAWRDAQSFYSGERRPEAK